MSETDQQDSLLEYVCDKYNGRLTLQEIHDGIIACLSNINRLMQDAKLLLESNRAASAMTLALTAEQEIGKLDVIRGMARIPPDKQNYWKDAWKRFRSHEMKSTLQLMHWFSFP